jgi:hypothetical protein
MLHEVNDTPDLLLVLWQIQLLSVDLSLSLSLSLTHTHNAGYCNLLCHISQSLEETWMGIPIYSLSAALDIWVICKSWQLKGWSGIDKPRVCIYPSLICNSFWSTYQNKISIAKEFNLMCHQQHSFATKPLSHIPARNSNPYSCYDWQDGNLTWVLRLNLHKLGYLG